MLLCRRGFTLVEVVVSVVLIDVGLLALVAGSAMLVRQSNQLRARNVALRSAANRLQTLGASACVASTGVSMGPLGTRELWSVNIPVAGVRELRDSVEFPQGATTASVVVRTRLPC